MSECEKDFTKLSIKIDEQATLTQLEQDIKKGDNANKLTPEVVKKLAEAGMDTLGNLFMNKTNNNATVDICVKKCANKTLPMIMFDKSKKYELKETIENINNSKAVLCFSEPSSEKELAPVMEQPELSSNYTDNQNNNNSPSSFDYQQWAVEQERKQQEEAAARLARLAASGSADGSYKPRENLSETDLYDKSKFKYKITYKCAQGEINNNFSKDAKKCTYTPPFYFLKSALK